MAAAETGRSERMPNIFKLVGGLLVLCSVPLFGQYLQFQRVQLALSPGDLFSNATSAIASYRLPEAFILPSVLTDMTNQIQTAMESTLAEPEEESEQQLPIIAICSCAVSMKQWTASTKTSLETLMIPSIGKSITDQEKENFRFQLRLGFDEGDAYWTQHLSRIQTPDWLEFIPTFYPKSKSHKIPFNPLLLDGYNAGVDYFVRINDDTEFTTTGWASAGVRVLKAMEPSNVGVVVPWGPRNARMFTHDMCHRTHLDIFEGKYYPDAFSNWWIDDWITSVYRPFRSKWVKSWAVTHHNVHGTRYKVDNSQKRHLMVEIEKGRAQIKTWLESHGFNSTEKPFDKKLLDTERSYKSISDIPPFWIAE